MFYLSQLAMVFFLLLNSAASKAGQTHVAARVGDWNLVFTLIDQGANIDEIDIVTRETLFDIANANGKEMEAKKLIRRGATTRTIKIESPISPSELKTKDFISYLNLIPEIEQKTTQIFKKDISRTIYSLIPHIDINLEIEGTTPLMAAINARIFFPTILCLLQHGADPNKMVNAISPIEMAIKKDLKIVAWMLFEHGAKYQGDSKELEDFLAPPRILDLLKNLGDKHDSFEWDNRIHLLKRKTDLIASYILHFVLRHIYLMATTDEQRNIARILILGILEDRFQQKGDLSISQQNLIIALKDAFNEVFSQDERLQTINGLFAFFLQPDPKNDDKTPVARLEMIDELFSPNVDKKILHEIIGNCSICIENDARLKFLGCHEHMYCENCYRHFLKDRVKLRDKEFKCMDPSCKVLLDEKLVYQLLPESIIKDHEKEVEHQNRRINNISNGRSRFYLCGQLLKGTARFFLCGAFCPAGGVCCLSDFIHVDIEQCPKCHTIIEYDGGCPMMTCGKCGWKFVKHQQCNTPCYCFTVGAYCPYAVWLSLGIPAICCHRSSPSVCLPCVWIKKL